MAKRGKKLTVNQMKLVERELGDEINIKDWLYCSTVSINDDGLKHAAKNGSNTRYMNIIHKVTGEIKKIII